MKRLLIVLVLVSAALASDIVLDYDANALDWNDGMTHLLGMYFGDVDADSTSEAVVVGQGSPSCGYMRVMNVTSGSFVTECNLSCDDSFWEEYPERVSAADLDADPALEIAVTGAGSNGSLNRGFLRVFNVTGSSLVLEDNTSWDEWGLTTYASAVFAGDAEGNSDDEVVVVGNADNGSIAVHGFLRLYNLTAGALALESKTTWQEWDDEYTYPQGVSVGDVDGDSSKEIVVAGIAWNGSANNAFLRVFNVSGEELVTENVTAWVLENGNSGDAYDVFVGNVDGDGALEMAVVGRGTVGNYKAFLYVFNMSSDVIQLEYSTEWQVFSGFDSVARSVFVADVDEDALNEILVASFGGQGAEDDDQASVRVYDTSGSLVLEQSRVWQAFSGQNPSQLFCVSAGDADGDSADEVLVGGFGTSSGPRGFVGGFEVDETSPSVSLSSPDDASMDYDGDVSFQYVVSDKFGLSNCTLFVNGSVNVSESSLTNGSVNYFNKTLGNGTYVWRVGCYDAAHNFANSTAIWSVDVRILGAPDEDADGDFLT
ncbi:MAG: hypothetical protein JW834_01620, partial [Candidatus Diapherotrites archaeon]|nr:hypothetical protein [Candidatus Diapherotrites archaeon]